MECEADDWMVALLVGWKVDGQVEQLVEWMADALSVPQLLAQDWETAYPSTILGLEHLEGAVPQGAGVPGSV